jgi:Beta protein
MRGNRQIELDLKTKGDPEESATGSSGYVPVLKSRAGELRALATLDSRTKHAITPLIEFTPPASDAEAHLVQKADSLLSACGQDQRFFADCRFLNDFQVDAAMSATRYLLELMMDRRMRPVPVISTSMDHEAVQAMVKLVQSGAEGACFRIPMVVDAKLDEINDQINDLLRMAELDPARTDLVLDYGSIFGAQHLGYARSLRNTIAGLVHALEWRSLIVSATAFPETLSNIGPDSQSSFERIEWQAWSGLAEGTARIGRIPTFSDYVTAGVRLPHTKVRPALSLRYTQDHEWVVFKGRVHSKAEPNFAFRRMCSDLISSQAFSGPQTSWGDRYLAGYVDRTTAGSSSTVWRQVATSHHLTFVAHQLAKSRPATKAGQRTA